ncbi:hypothetical protein HT031_004927 [Scenedesmus sp. PABB004]|nr:hypothetical protein HT031_004927 [Scenedesmus sp. PABB004]
MRRVAAASSGGADPPRAGSGGPLAAASGRARGGALARLLRGPRRGARVVAVVACLATLGALGAAAALAAAGGAAPAGDGDGLAHLAAAYRGPVASAYGVEGGYWRLDVNFTSPRVPLLARPRFAASNATCWELAAATRQPFTALYQPTGAPPAVRGRVAAAGGPPPRGLRRRAAPAAPRAGRGRPPAPARGGARAQDLPGGVPRALFRWRGRISRRLFDSVPFLLRESPAAGGCPHCTFVLRYKVLGGQLYADRARRRRALDGQEAEVAMVEELLLAALHMHEVPRRAAGPAPPAPCPGGPPSAPRGATIPSCAPRRPQVPDVDFLLHIGDGAPGGLPLVQASVNRSEALGGFTLPKYMWRDALGLHQFAVLAQCLAARHPPPPAGRRVGRAVWRGSATDPAHALVDEGNALRVLRARLHLFGVWYPSLFDAHLTAFPQQAFETSCVETLLPPGACRRCGTGAARAASRRGRGRRPGAPPSAGRARRAGPALPLEAFNGYALVLDADGNSWSDRYRLLAHGNTPVLKQASNLSGFFEHLLPPGVAAEHWAPDASDLPARAAALLGELAASPRRLVAMAGAPGGFLGAAGAARRRGGRALADACARPRGWPRGAAERQQGLAALLLNQVALAHAAAWTLARVAALSDWRPAREEGYDLVPFARCCPSAAALPREFVAAVRARGEALGQAAPA